MRVRCKYYGTGRCTWRSLRASGAGNLLEIPDILPRLQAPYSDMTVLFSSRQSYPHHTKLGTDAFVLDLNDVPWPLETFDAVKPRPMKTGIPRTGALNKRVALRIPSAHFYLEPDLGSRFPSANVQNAPGLILKSSFPQLDPSDDARPDLVNLSITSQPPRLPKLPTCTS